nr:hypothetical protein [candidate division Zixibacteria bacterium]
MTGILDNLWVKIAAVILAVLLWFHVATDKVYQYSLTLPLAQVDLTGDLVLLEPPPDSVRVVVSATGKTLLRSDWKKRGLRLSINRGHVGIFKVDLALSNLGLVKVDKVELTDIIEPREIYVTCDTRMEKEIPVHSRVVVMPDDGYAVSENDSIIPAAVMVSGPKRYVTDIQFMETEKTVLEGVRNDFARGVAVVSPEMYGLKITPDSVTAYINVQPVRRRDFKDLSIRLINSPPLKNVAIEPSTINIRVSGISEAIDSLTDRQISIIADYILKGQNDKIPIQVVVPPSVSILYKSSDSVDVIEEK